MGMRRSQGRTTAVAALLVAGAGAFACGEDLLAPGDGTCPAYCPPERVVVVDTLLPQNVTSDSTFVGYVVAAEAVVLQLVSDSGSATLPTSRAVVRFRQFPERILLGAGDTTTAAVLQIDSFTIELDIRGRNLDQAGLELVLYRLPADVDTTADFAALTPFFDDSTRLATVAVPDTLIDGSVSVQLDSTAFPSFAADSNRAAIGVTLQAPNPAYVNIGSLETNAGLILTRFVQVDSAGTSVPRSDGRLPAFDTFVAPASPAMAPGERATGGVPSARTLLRFAIPPRVADSATVLRATLVLVPTMPVLGAPGDSVRVIAQGLSADVGAKSPLVSVPPDSLTRRWVVLPTGWADTVRLDVTDLVIGWSRFPARPRALMVRATPEGSAFGQVRFAASGTPGAPALQITFVPPLTLGGR